MPGVHEAGWFRTGYCLGLLLRAWRRTVRLEIRRAAKLPESWLLALWHGRIVGVLFERMWTSTVAMASRSADGALAAGALAAVGIRAARGSTGKGGAQALSEMESLVRSGVVQVPALTVDGPRGPWRQVKAGAVTLASRLGIPIVPASFSCRHVWRLRSWDSMLLPKPFSRVVVVFGAPIPPQQLPGDGEEAAREVSRIMVALDRELDLEVAGREWWPEPGAGGAAWGGGKSSES